MYIFQVIAFFLQLFFWILAAGILFFCPKVFFSNKSSEKVNISYNVLNSHKKSKLEYIGVKILGSAIAILIIAYFALPYLLDIPKLITGNFNYVTGYVYDVRTESKDPNEYVYIEGKKLKFFFGANVEMNKIYTIGYLPHTSRAIYGLKLDGSTLKVEKKIAFPIKKLLFFIGIMATFVLLWILSPYIRFKLLIIACIIYYPINLYLYINYGISSGIWFSLSNQGLLFLLIGAAVLLLLGIFYFIEQPRDYETPFTLFFIQLFSILKILVLLGEELHLL